MQQTLRTIQRLRILFSKPRAVVLGVQTPASRVHPIRLVLLELGRHLPLEIRKGRHEDVEA